MLKAFKSVFEILVLGFLKLPFNLWKISKQRLINQYDNKQHIYETLDDEYFATNWLDWAVDCGIFLIYPLGFTGILLAVIFSFELLILLALIPIYFAPVFILETHSTSFPNGIPLP